MSKKILFVSHDASRTGAPIVLLHLLRWLKSNSDFKIGILLMKGGELEDEFKTIGKTYLWNKQIPASKSLLARSLQFVKSILLNKLGISSKKKIWRQIRNTKYDILYGNTVVALKVFSDFSFINKKILHIHELPFSIEDLLPPHLFMNSIHAIDTFIVVSKLVEKKVTENYNIPDYKLNLVHEFSTIPEGIENIPKLELRAELGIPEDVFIIGGSGTISWRKGTDIFIQVANELIKKEKERPIYFIWLGEGENGKYGLQIKYDLEQLGIQERVKLIGSKSNPFDFYHVFDLFLMTSREDPFPLVCIENAMVGNPIICFADVVGSQEFIDDSVGAVVPYLDVYAMVDKIMKYYDNNNKAEDAGRKIKDRVKDFTEEVSGLRIKKILDEI